jgi:glycosyltransferase involved in cell wall biosynthesis
MFNISKIKLIDQQIYSDSEEKFCVIIPTFNNASKIEEVINGVLNHIKNIIVVNDGTTDNTEIILDKFKKIVVVSYSKNKGKGYALKQGFKKALELGYNYAITIDSDGQHSASEIPEFIKTCNNHKDALIIGARTTINGNVPRKNSFANKFSNFWVFIITGIKLIDTQSGFRLYPLNKMQNIKFVSRRYEFELEVLAKASWRNIPIISIPISVFYPPNNERITHFRPFIDFLRISLLNSWLVFLGLAIYRPLNITKSLFRKFKKLF